MSRYTFTINEQSFDVEIQSVQGGTARVTVNHVPYTVTMAGGARAAAAPTRIQSMAAAPIRVQPTAAPTPAATRVRSGPAPAVPAKAAAPSASGAGTITAQIPGKIINVGVNVGDQVAPGQVVAIMEAMKMENNILSPISGMVKDVRVSKDMDVATGDVLMIIA